MQAPLVIGYSLPMRTRHGEVDSEGINDLVRDLVAALPVGVVLDENARQTLRTAQPYANGTVVYEQAAAPSEESYADAWRVVLANKPKLAGARLAVGTKEAPLVLLEIEPGAIASLNPINHAGALLYGPRRR